MSGKRQHPEDALQKATLELCARLRVDRKALYFHVPNGGKRDRREAGRLKRLGVLAGAPDLLFLASGRAYCLELKAPGGRLRPSQVAFRAECDRLGIPYRVADDLDEVRAVLDKWGLT